MALWSHGGRRGDSPKMLALEKDAGLPAGESNTAQMQRRAFRLVSLVKEVNFLVVNHPHEVRWIGSHLVIKQMLPAVQQHLKVRFGEAWQIPAPRLVLQVTDKVYKPGMEAQLAMEELDVSSTARSGESKPCGGRRASSKPRKRPMGSQIGNTCATPATWRCTSKGRAHGNAGAAAPDRASVPVHVLILQVGIEEGTTLYAQDMSVLEQHARAGTTSQIEIGDARLLVDSLMHSIKALQVGAGDLFGFNLSPDLVRDVLCIVRCLRQALKEMFHPSEKK